MQGVHLEDVRRALDARDPMLPLLIVSLASGPDHVPSAQGAPPPASGELDWSGFLREIGSWRFGQKSDEERRRYRTESLAALRAQERLPERLWLDAIVLELWEEQGAYARSVLLQIVRDVPIKWGPWRALKLIFKQAEERHDTENVGGGRSALGRRALVSPSQHGRGEPGDDDLYGASGVALSAACGRVVPIALCGRGGGLSSRLPRRHGLGAHVGGEPRLLPSATSLQSVELSLLAPAL